MAMTDAGVTGAGMPDGAVAEVAMRDMGALPPLACGQFPPGYFQTEETGASR